MGKLEELRAMVSDLFAKAEDKETIEQIALVSNKFDEVVKEQEQLINKNGELLKSYKDLVLHTSFKDSPAVGDTPASTGELSFEDALANFLSKGEM